MKMSDRKDDMADLDVFFDAAKTEQPGVSDALMDRIMADANSVADEWQREISSEPVKDSWVRRVLNGIGGWPAVSGMATATVLGVAVGISPPALLTEMTAGYLDGTADPYLVDPYDAFGFEMSEG